MNESFAIISSALGKYSIAIASSLSGSMVRTLRVGEEFLKMFCLVTSSLRLFLSRYSIVCDSTLLSGGVEKIGCKFVVAWYLRNPGEHKEVISGH